MGALAPVTSWIPQDDLLLKNAVEVMPERFSFNALKTTPLLMLLFFLFYMWVPCSLISLVKGISLPVHVLEVNVF